MPLINRDAFEVGADTLLAAIGGDGWIRSSYGLNGIFNGTCYLIIGEAASEEAYLEIGSTMGDGSLQYVESIYLRPIKGRRQRVPGTDPAIRSTDPMLMFMVDPGPWAVGSPKGWIVHWPRTNVTHYYEPVG